MLTIEPPAAVPRRQFSLYSASAAAFRWLHIYLSMLGFSTLMFFAFTGLTLNHPTWFGAANQSTRDEQGTLPEELRASLPLTETEIAALAEVETPPRLDQRIDKLGIAEWLRSRYRLRGRVSEFSADEFECLIVYKGPGYAADVFLDRASGDFTLTETTTGVMALLNDLHKGRDSGPQWSWVIDVSAVLTLLLSLSGFGLLFYLRRRRVTGVLTAVVGTLLLIAVWAWWVP